MADYTTRNDDSDILDAGDAGQLDIGYHYVDIDPNRPKQFELAASVFGGQGSILPESGLYYAGTTVELKASPQSGGRVDRWSGTDNDSPVPSLTYCRPNFSDRSKSPTG